MYFLHIHPHTGNYKIKIECQSRFMSILYSYHTSNIICFISSCIMHIRMYVYKIGFAKGYYTHIQFWSLRSVIQLVFHLQLSNLVAGLDPIIALIKGKSYLDTLLISKVVLCRSCKIGSMYGSLLVHPVT